MSVAISTAESFVVNRGLAALIALAAIVLLLLIAQALITHANPADPGAGLAAQRRRGIKALVMGADGRASTSKLQAVLWLGVIVFAFAFLFVWGRSTNCGASNVKEGEGCSAAATARAAFDNTLSRPLQSEYFVLLGFPLTAAIAAKALTVNKIATGEKFKPPIGTSPSTDKGGDGNVDSDVGIGKGLAEIVTNDSGETDLLDFQYFAFNLLALAYFLVQFLTHPADGLPTLPPTLIALTGVSVAAYTTKKALDTDVLSTIVRVVPNPCSRAADTKISIQGGGFGPATPVTDPPTPPDATRRYVTLKGQRLPIVSWSDREVVATITAEAETVLDADEAAPVVVIDSEGQASPIYSLGLNP